jgi:hypothetical protein
MAKKIRDNEMVISDSGTVISLDGKSYKVLTDPQTTIGASGQFRFVRSIWKKSRCPTRAKDARRMILLHMHYTQFPSRIGEAIGDEYRPALAGSHPAVCSMARVFLPDQT